MKRLLLILGLVGVVSASTLNAGSIGTLDKPGNHKKESYRTSDGKKIKINHKNDGTVKEKTYSGKTKMNPKVKKFDQNGNLIKESN